MPRLIAALVAVAVIVSVVVLVRSSQTPPNVRFGDTVVNVSVVSTPIDRQVGLGRTDYLAPDQGMLFVFDIASNYGFWMKDMKFPIDIIWLDETRRIVSIEANVYPDTYPRIFYPSFPSLYVLETNAGWTTQHGIHVGDIAHLNL